MNFPRTALSHRVRVYDHAGVELYQAHRDHARELLHSGGANPIILKGRIRGIRLTGPDPALLGEAGRKRTIGMPHRLENYYNLKGVWHIDRIPARYCEAFHHSRAS